MNQPAAISLEPDLPAAAVEELFHQLALSGERHAPPRRQEPLNLVLRDAQGTLRGGLLGSFAWGWLQVDLLWVDETFRGRGHGRALLEQAESLAVSRGCRHARLDSFDFGALPLYQKLGYVIYGRLDGYPEGHTQYFLRKALPLPLQ